LTTILYSSSRDYSVAELTGRGDNPNFEEVQKAFDHMRKAAAKEGIELLIVSGYRNFDRQRAIWNRKWQRYQRQGFAPDSIFNRIVTYSTLPGTSRHHWGTDLDLIDGNKTYDGDALDPNKFEGTGPFCEMFEWMYENAADYGFHLVYTNEIDRKGFNYEPWHWSYKPLAKQMLRQYLDKIQITELLAGQEVAGADEISEERLNLYYREHILGINSELK
jgi:LAS superfamily LD-carboxypeptidase LdcB